MLRGPSAVGKSTIAHRLREAYARRHLALVPQDLLRRQILRERDEPGAPNIDLIQQTADLCLARGFHTVVEGILDAGRYGAMLQKLAAGHPGPSHFFYLDASFEETVKRHASKPQASEYGEAEMRSWYRERDLLPGLVETVIDEDSTAEQSLAQILTATRLLDF